MTHRKEPEEIRLKETVRVEAFSDGVFAIAITLLVLELIQILHPQNGESPFRFYLHHWEPFLAFLIGFLTIMVCWINHHHVFTYIKRTDSKLLWVNGLVLFIITFTPFPTAILAEYLAQEGKYALSIFGINYFIVSLASYGLCAYSYNKLLIDHEDREFFYCVRLTYAYSIPYTFVAFFICFLYYPAAILMYVILFLVFAFPKDFATRLLKRRQEKIGKSKLNRKPTEDNISV